ncbi:MAG: diguanylate cyclase [Sideroxydans sp.]|nr:diguanylate cyclase [Sideroxydans sp.]
MLFIFKSVVLVVLYVLAAKIGLSFGTVSNSATIFWPPSGIALAALLLGGIQFLPSIFVAAYIVAIMVDAPIIFALGSAAGNTLEPLVGYLLINRIGSVDLKLSRIRDLWLVILAGGAVPSIVSAILGPLALMQSGLISSEMLPAIMWRWWRADVLGIAFFTPLILVFSKNKARHFQLARTGEILALWISSFLVGQYIFFDWQVLGISFEQRAGIAWVFPFLIWAGLRSGRRNSALIQLMLLTQALLSAHLQTGLFAEEFSRNGLANFWMFAMLMAITGMTLAILSSAHRKSTKQNELSAKVFAVSQDGIVIVDADNKIVAVNPAFTKLTGYTSEEAVGSNPSLMSSGSQSREFYADMWKTLTECGRWEGEVWNRRKDGSAFLEKLSIHSLLDSQGRVINRIGIFTDITLSKAEQENVAHQAQHDFLTNLPNRLLFQDRFNQQLAIAKRHKSKFAVIFMDLNGFKSVNDSLGHRVGDLLLIAVAERLSVLVREIDTVSRFGGDEFAILVTEVKSEQDVSNLADKIHSSLMQTFVIEGNKIDISGSLGVAIYPEDGADMETLLCKADSAMYRAKVNCKDMQR